MWKNILVQICGVARNVALNTHTHIHTHTHTQLHTHLRDAATNEQDESGKEKKEKGERTS